VRKNLNAQLAGGSLSRTSTALPELDVAGEVIGSPEREPGRIVDEKGNKYMEDGQLAEPITSEFVERLKEYFQMCVEKCRWRSEQAADALAGLLSLLGVKRRGRRPKPEGAQTAAERKRKQRQREKDWDWLPFPIIAHAGYLVIEASPEDGMPVFDNRRAHVVIGFELQPIMDAHHKDYPHHREFTPGQLDPEFWTDLGEVKTVVLRYPDKIIYIAAATDKPPAIDDVLRGKGFSSLNRGMFLTKAPHGKGKLVTGWGHKKGYNDNTSEFQPELDDVGDFYADEFASDDDDQGAADNPGRFDDAPEPEQELDEVVEKDDEDSDKDESNPDETTDELKCKICKEVLEGEDDDDTLLMKHLKERHPNEYRRILVTMDKDWHKQQEAEKKRLRRQLEKQTRCTNDHDGMFARRLKATGADAYFCGGCGAPLCRSTHIGQVVEVFAERAAERAKLSYLDQRAASKRKPAPIYCKYCHEPIYVTDYGATAGISQSARSTHHAVERSGSERGGAI
jgi:hypothetical protein